VHENVHRLHPLRPQPEWWESGLIEGHKGWGMPRHQALPATRGFESHRMSLYSSALGSGGSALPLFSYDDEKSEYVAKK